MSILSTPAYQKSYQSEEYKYGVVTVSSTMSAAESEQQQWKDLQTLVVKMNTKLTDNVSKYENVFLLVDFQF
jgi:hypothetical protein